MYSGIYYYKDKNNDGEIIYIGKDSHINKNKRYKDHLYPSNYKCQKINQILQNNPNRYDYFVLKKWETNNYSKNLANALEILYIKKYAPRFNFTIGGEGICGLKKSKESIEKQRQKVTGRRHTEEAKRKIGLASKGRVFSKETRQKISDATKRQMAIKENRDNLSRKMSGSNNHRWKSYPRIIKNGYKYGKQNYALKYNGKTIYSSVYYDKVTKRLDELKKEINNYELGSN